MASFQASYQTTTVAQALQSLVQLPGDFDIQKNLPTVSVNAHELVSSVSLLWNAMKDQRGFLETVEKEMARRKTEMEVRFQKMQTDVDTSVAQEARKRQSEDEKLRQEMATMRDEMQKHADAVRRETKESQDAFQRSMDRTVGSVKASVAEAQQKVGDLAIEVSSMKDELARLKGDQSNLQALTDKTRSESQGQFTTLCNFIGASPMVVQQAVSNGSEKEAMLKTPALQTLAQRIRMADEKAEAAKTDAAKAAAEALQLGSSLTKVVGDVSKLELHVNTIDQVLRDAITLGDEKLSQRIDALERGVNAQLAHLGKNSVAAAPTVMPSADGANKSDLESLRAAFEQLKHDVGTRIAGKAEQAEVNDAVKAINSVLDRHDQDIATLFAGQGAAPSVVPVQRRGSVDADAVKALQDLADRVNALEHQCQDLHNVKADRSELRLGLSDLAKKMENGLSELYHQLQNLKKELSQQQVNPYPPASQDATAGRFRCISCNRDAGPLQEQIQERLSKSQFPPSPMIVSQAGAQRGTNQSGQGSAPGRSIVQSHQSVPGLKEYGGSMTSSRKKLMNYYVWLQDKNDHPNPNQQARSRPTSAGHTRDSNHANGSISPRSRSPGSQHPWAGAQSGNGAYGERQCGDHGTPEPEAVGIDGKYYIGVTGTTSGGGRPRPTSAPARGRAPTHADNTAAAAASAVPE
jgi:predicted nuclease of predicted toxin-antitoxin system